MRQVVYISNDFYARMRQYPSMNWSLIARTAFTEAMRLSDAEEANANPEPKETPQ